jgi:2-hydroxychromene-2-carboxylate isomerase
VARATFYFDLGSPYAYLTAERLGDAIAEPVHWQPISLGALFKHNGRGSWALAGEESRGAGISEVEQRARRYGLPPVVWPERWPSHYLMAMRAATFAFSAGRGHEFSIEAFRASFQRGEELSEPDAVLDAAERVGLSREDVRAASEDDAVKLALREATDTAHALGVIGVPTIVVDGEPFWGDDRVQDAAARLATLA